MILMPKSFSESSLEFLGSTRARCSNLFSGRSSVESWKDRRWQPMSICRHGPIWIIFSHLRIFRADRHKEEPRQIVCVSRCSDVPTEKLFFFCHSRAYFFSIRAWSSLHTWRCLVNQRDDASITGCTTNQYASFVFQIKTGEITHLINLFWRLSLVRVCMLWSSDVRISPSVMLLWETKLSLQLCKLNTDRMMLI
jgi:hypothetical protein